ncbi:MAG: isoleucine--tRNA ligase [Actinobacteria bacterium]|nr:isoleucine--tRNA ligase [Actinomycetota bacterium]
MFQKVKSPCDFVADEHKVLKFWQETDTFEKLRAKNRGQPPWSFLDGPITANNPMGVHHAWGRTLKDVFQRYFAMTGHELRYQNGFDCQGLWVEVEVEKELGFTSKKDIEEYGLDRFVNKCKERVRKYAKVQTDQSIRLGYWMDWSDSYFTMTDENNYTIWSFLKKCHDRGLVYKGTDVMPWCPRCGVGLSQMEMHEGYKFIPHRAVFLRLPLRNLGPGKQIPTGEKHYLLIWTTTPWTLTCNVACAVSKELTYLKVRGPEGATYYFAEGCLDYQRLAEEFKSKDWPETAPKLATVRHILEHHGGCEILGKLKGSELIGWEYDGPFDELPAQQDSTAANTHRVIPWEDVQADEGSGIVHIAPGCGAEDHRLAAEQGLIHLAPLDESGVYIEGFDWLTGRNASDHQVTTDIIENLKSKGLIVEVERYPHRYPHCWRCNTELLYRLVDEWFISMSWRDEIMKVVDDIHWIPSYGRDREMDWLGNMRDWMISKKRYWGLALPIFECSCGHFEVIGSRDELQTRAVEGWEQFDGQSPHRPWIDAIKIHCEKCGQTVDRIPDVGNPWLDAGIVPYSTVRYNTDREYWKKWIPADLVLECFPGQFRNWFYALLAMSAMMEGIAPFKTLLGHALVRDEQGQEMHKSLGNSIAFEEAAEKMGVDVMRWMFCRQSPVANLNFGYHIGSQIRSKIFNTFWNVYAFFANYARLDGFDPATGAVPLEKRQDIDRWLLSRLHQLTDLANRSLADFDTAALLRRVEEFFEDLSNWYVRRNRRRFWRPRSSDDTDKLAAYQTLYQTLTTLVRLLAPITPFVCETIYQNLVRSFDPDAPESVHHCEYPKAEDIPYDQTVCEEMDIIVAVVSRALSLREKHSLRVRQPLTELIVKSDDELTRAALERFREQLLDELNVKKLSITSDLSGEQEISLKPNFKTLGPKYHQDLKTISAVLAQADAAVIAAQVEAGQEVTLTEPDGDKSWKLVPEDILLEKSWPKNLAVAEPPGHMVALNIEITPELFCEGLARDLVRHIQQIRKEIDLQIEDRITTIYATDSQKVTQAIAEHSEYICRETLCDSLTAGSTDNGKSITIAGESVTLKVNKA